VKIQMTLGSILTAGFLLAGCESENESHLQAEGQNHQDCRKKLRWNARTRCSSM